MDLKDKLNDMFDIEGAVINKTQTCPVGRWAFTVAMTVFFGAVYAVCIWGALFFDGWEKLFLMELLTAALLFVLFRLWFAFAVDVASRKFAEITVFKRSGDKRCYYTRGKYLRKFEYEGGFIATLGKSYDKFEDKSDYSPLAGRFDRALQRRSSLYVTMTPAFWYDMISGGEYTVTDDVIKAKAGNASVTLTCGADGKIRRIEYVGSGYYLYDSASPIKIFDAKLPGKYRITYTFNIGEQEQVAIEPIFRTAMDDFLMPPPSEELCRFE